VFLANGLGFANLVPRFPEIVAGLGLSKSDFGQAVAAASVGALVAGLAASWLISRLTSAKVASLGMLVVALALLGAGLARSWLPPAGCPPPAKPCAAVTSAIREARVTGICAKPEAELRRPTFTPCAARIICARSATIGHS